MLNKHKGGDTFNPVLCASVHACVELLGLTTPVFKPGPTTPRFQTRLTPLCICTQMDRMLSFSLRFFHRPFICPSRIHINATTVLQSLTQASGIGYILSILSQQSQVKSNFVYCMRD